MNLPYVVLPGDIDDTSAPSGGNVYDRRLCEHLATAGEIPVPGAWPRPDEAAKTDLTRALSALPDGTVVLLDGLVACGIPDIVVPHARRLRLAILVHLPLAEETGLPAEVAAELNALERETLHAVDAVVATSFWAARHLVDHHGLPAERVHVVPPGVDPAAPAEGTEGGTRLLCVGSLTPRKGHDVLVEALAAVAHLRWSCVFAGPSSRSQGHAEDLRRSIEDHDLADRIELAGPRTGESLDAAYADADLLILPSRAETYGMVVTEALARGIPVVATAVGGVPEALGNAPDGGTPGILVPPDDVTALAGAVRQWLRDGELRRRLRSAAQERRRTLAGWEETARRMAAVLDRLAPGFSPEWLALREPADAAARATQPLDVLPSLDDLPEKGARWVIRDLGCGTGSMGRWLAGRLTGPQHWILHDRDPELLRHAVGGMPDQAGDGSPVTVETREGDLSDLRAADLAGTSLVTASALLDVLTPAGMTALVEAIVAARCPALLTLSVIGMVELSPADPLDGVIEAAFNDHQRRSGLLGPAAAAAATEAFELRGAKVRSYPSPWLLGQPDQAALTAEWLRGWVGAACEQRPDLKPQAGYYLRRRLDTCAQGELRVAVHHTDLLVEPT
ncbi:glycosyltransferase [Actinomadura rudentiformis]|uniref:Glycosyltransferase n=1 Tax=Actinomadura rudentiformis TaxID=359158 RepID=A0A6H9ZDG4_9ACTN|nr:glycosyltransferase [Actinomadura rudentiformis]KAB2352579.1 glycosyltransferase [Actinomadura rudentiformis]